MLLVTLIVFAAACGTAGAETTGPEQAREARLSIVSEDPLVVRGTGFRPGERVKLLFAVRTRSGAIGAARASQAGRFTARLGVSAKPMHALVVQAIGARGSRATAEISVPTDTLAPRP